MYLFQPAYNVLKVSMNAPLSMGNIIGNNMTCPFHGDKFWKENGRTSFDIFARNGTITKNVGKKSWITQIS